MYGKRRRVLAAALLAVAAVVGARAEAVETGQIVLDLTLRRIDGGSAPVVDRSSAATVLIFFRAPHERSAETLRMLGACAPRLSGKGVRFVGIVPADSASEAKAAVAASGAKLDVLVDEGDSVYSALGVRTHPGIAILDRSRRVVAFEPYHHVDYCEIMVARIRRALGEASDADIAKTLAPAPSKLPGGDDRAGIARRHVAFGRKLLATRSYAPAHDNARKAIQLWPSASAWTLEGDVFAAEGRCPDATRAYDAALKLDPKDAGALAGKKACG